MRILLLCCLAWCAVAAEATLHRGAVAVSLRVESDDGGPVLVAAFDPDDRQPPLHLYAIDLPDDAPGLATRIALAPDAPITARGPLSADQPVQRLNDLPVYPDGATVTLRLPIAAPRQPGGGTVAIPVLVSYMACTADSCLIPVRLARLSVPVPAMDGTPAPPPAVAPAPPPAVAPAPPSEPVPDGPIGWRRPATLAEAEALIAQAHAAGRAALLDFTGPSCVNCQLMAKTVFRLPEVARAWNAGLPIEIDTDRHEDLAQWQQSRFQAQARPLYVRIAPGGGEARWDRVFAPDDQVQLGRFLAFLRDGTPGGATGIDLGLGGFVLLAVLGGLFTLVMPCTYPMVPFTLNMFAKQAAAGRRLAPLAAFYALGIIACFVGLGVLITGVLGRNLATLAGHPLTNLLVAALFVVLGLSLLGVFFLRLPAAWQGALGGGRGGYLGALVMGLTFAVTAFTCTAPFAGAVLAAAVATGSWGRAVAGMAIYAGTIALPFFLLALAPGLLARLPRAGAWMEEFKVVGGLVELAAALKFLAICDYAWGWGMIGRSSVLAAWAAIGLACAGYLAWRGRAQGFGPVRIAAVIAFLLLAGWLIAGLAGFNLGVVESFFPGDAAP